MRSVTVWPLALVLLGAPFPAAAQSASSPSYRITTQAVESGGSPTTATSYGLQSPNYRLVLTVGQLADVEKISASYSLSEGYLPTLDVPQLVFFTIQLSEGYNLIGLPLMPTSPMKASSLLESINSQGGKATRVLNFIPAIDDYETYTAGGVGVDFAVNTGVGYFVRCGGASTWEFAGYKLDQEFGIVQLVAGYSMIALPVEPNPPTRYDARAVLDEINGQNGSTSIAIAVANRILLFNGLGYDVYTVEGVGTNFPVEMGVGYFIRCTQAATWTVYRRTKPPSAPIITSPLQLTTNVVTLTIKGFTEPFAKVRLYELDQARGEVVASVTGAWSIPLPAYTAEGPHQYVAKASNGAGESDPSAVVTITIDIQPPTVQITRAPTSPALSGEAVVEFTSNEAGVIFERSLDNSVYQPVVSPDRLIGLADVVAHIYCVRAVDGAGNVSLPAIATWTVDSTQEGSPLRITTYELPPGVANESYTQPLGAVGGTRPYVWTCTGTLPAGLSLNSETGTLSGTPDLAAAPDGGIYTFIVEVTDASTPAVSATQSLSLHVAEPFQIVTAALDSGASGWPYSFALQASGGNTPYTWTLEDDGGSGFALSPDGLLTGMQLNTESKSYELTLSITDSTPASTGPLTRRATLQLKLAAALVLDGSLQAGVVGMSYAASLGILGGREPYSWKVQSGMLPPGITLTGKGQFEGIPIQEGLFEFTVEVSDGTANPGPQRATASLQINVTEPVQIVTQQLPRAVNNKPYSAEIRIVGGAPDFTWSVSTQASGITLSDPKKDRTATLSWDTPTSGTYLVTITVEDSSHSIGTTAPPLSLTVLSGTSLVVDSLPCLPGVVGVEYSHTFNAVGGTPPYSWRLADGSPELHVGLSLDSGTGRITGVPQEAGEKTIAVIVTDIVNQSAGPQTFVLAMAPRLRVWTGAPPLEAITTHTLPEAARGVRYTPVQLEVNEGADPLTWSVSAGTLPPGITLSAAGVLGGAPTADATSDAYVFTVLVTDAQSFRATRENLTINIRPDSSKPTIASTALPLGLQDADYHARLLASGGTPGYTWGVVEGVLPEGVTLNADNGVLAGTPTVFGDYPFVVRATDRAGLYAERIITLHIEKATSDYPVITTQALPPGFAGSSYSATLSANGGAGPYYWESLDPSQLPPGLTLDSNGTISGEIVVESPPDYPKTYTVNVIVYDVDYNFGDAKEISITVYDRFTITQSLLPNAARGKSYTVALVAAAPSSVAWTLVAPSTLPSGLVLNGNGQITGIPSTAGSYTFVVNATDGISSETKTIRLTVDDYQPLEIVTTQLPPAEVGASYSTMAIARGGIVDDAYSWSISTNPATLALSIEGGGTIRGTPTEAGLYAVTVTLVNGASSVSKTWPLVVQDHTRLTVDPTPLPDGAVDIYYLYADWNYVQLKATGARAACTWSIIQGNLPLGLDLSGDWIYGTPSEAGSYTFTVRVSDGVSAPASQEMTIVIYDPPQIEFDSPTNASIGDYVEIAPRVMSNCKQPLRWSVGALPKGLALDPRTGVISGYVNDGSSYPALITALDEFGQMAYATVTFDITSRVENTTTELPPGAVGQAYYQTISAVGGTKPYNWSISSGALPEGLTYVYGEYSDAITGSPAAPGTWYFTLRVTDAAGQTADKPLSIRIEPPPQNPPPSLPDAVLGVLYAVDLASAGGNPPVAWHGPYLTSAWIIAPLGLCAVEQTGPFSGRLQGVPAVGGTFEIDLAVTDSTQPVPAQHTRTFRLHIAPPLRVLTQRLPDSSVGVGGYSGLLQAEGGNPVIVSGNPVYSWRLASGTLPPDLSLSAAGQISGRPTTPGLFTFQVTASDNTAPAGSVTATAELTISVQSRFRILTAQLPPANVGVLYLALLESEGGNPPALWDVTSGSLPPGLTLSAGGILSGTPSIPGLYTFTIGAIDNAWGGGSAVASATYSIAVDHALSIESASPLPKGSVGHPFAWPFTAQGGRQPLTWSVASGSLPLGLRLDAASGILADTPTTTGTYAFTLRVAESVSFAGAISATKTFEMTVVNDAEPPSPPSAVVATADDTRVSLSWALNHESENVVKYAVFRATKSGGPYSLLSEPTGTTFSDTGVTNGVYYFYVVSAINGSGLASAPSSEVYAMPKGAGDTLPAAPYIATPPKRTNDTTPVITGIAAPGTWIDVLSDGLVVGSSASETGLDGTWSVEISPALAENADYILFARAKTSTNQLSALSNALAISIDTNPPAAVTGLTALAGDGFVDLVWQPNGENDLLGYNIYRKAAGAVDYAKINSLVVVGNQYRDGTAVPSTDYLYTVTAVDRTTLDVPQGH